MLDGLKKALGKKGKPAPKPKAAAPKTPAKKAPRKATPREPETKPRDAAEVMAYEDGRRARASSIDRRGCPHAHGKERDAWADGWDFENEVRT